MGFNSVWDKVFLLLQQHNGITLGNVQILVSFEAVQSKTLTALNWLSHRVICLIPNKWIIDWLQHKKMCCDTVFQFCILGSTNPSAIFKCYARVQMGTLRTNQCWCQLLWWKATVHIYKTCGAFIMLEKLQMLHLDRPVSNVWTWYSILPKGKLQ